MKRIFLAFAACSLFLAAQTDNEIPQLVAPFKRLTWAFWWNVSIEGSLLAALFVAAFLLSTRKERQAANVARATAVLAAQAAAEAIASIPDHTEMQFAKLNISGGNFECARGLIAQALDTYNARSAAVSTPDTVGLSADEYRSMTDQYKEVTRQIERANNLLAGNSDSVWGSKQKPKIKYPKREKVVYGSDPW